MGALCPDSQNPPSLPTTDPRRVGIFLTSRCYRNLDEVWADESYVGFFVKLTRTFAKTTLFVPLTEDDPSVGKFKIGDGSGHPTVVGLPFFKSSRDLYLNFPRFAKTCDAILKPYLAELDLFISTSPNILGLHLARTARHHRIPTSLIMRGDLYKSVVWEYGSSRIKYLAMLMARYLEWQTERLMRQTPTFVVGHELHAKYQAKGLRSIPFYISLISREDIVAQRPLVAKECYQVLCVSRLSPEKGGVTLMESLALLEQQTPGRLHVTLVGEGINESRMRSMAEAAKLNVTFAGFIPFGPRVQQLYRDADLFVLPSYTEGFPLVLLEAMAFGCPIVATDVGGVGRIMKDGHNSLIVPSRNAPALAEAITRMLDDLSLRQRLRDQATQDVGPYTIEDMAELFKQNLARL